MIIIDTKIIKAYPRIYYLFWYQSTTKKSFDFKQNHAVLFYLTPRTYSHIMSNANDINYQEKLARISSGIADAVAHVEHMLEYHLEITNKVKLTRAIGIRARVNEMNCV